MLPCNLRTWTWGHILLAMISILAVLDASTVPTPASTNTAPAVSVNSTVSTKSQPGNNSSSVTVQSSSFNQSSATSPVLTGPTVHSLTVTGATSRTLIETNEPNMRNSTQTQASQETFTPTTSKMTDSRNLVSQGSENTTFTKTEPTPPTVQSSNSATVPQSTSLRMEVLYSQTTVAPSTITCLGLGSFTSTSQVVCFQYEEETTCETLDEKKKEELRSFLCGIMNTTQCNVTIHSSEVQPKCILWVPTSRDAEVSVHAANNLLPAQIKWGQISDHQTRSQKTMIALVTCGVLLAGFILAGYFLSNRESWSPGRQRLGEDPYCTETDSQGNTLVSVSAHAQDKPNSGTRENGTGQTVSPAATNGHSTKKQTVSDTEL